MKNEDVWFQGILYRRYVNAKVKSKRDYFRSFPDGKPGKMLHRAIWEHHKGPIPPKMHIHHLDGNPLNNDISNLQCITPEEHYIEHIPARSAHIDTEKHKAHLKRARVLASEWHGSPEGIKWHSEHSKRMWSNRVKFPLICINCGGAFEGTFKTSRFCSRSCYSKNRWKMGLGRRQK